MTLDHLHSLREDVDRQFKRASVNVSVETKQFANHKLRELAPKMRRVTRPGAYEDFLLDRMQAEVEKHRLYNDFQDSEKERKAFLEECDYDSLREKPVCTCSGVHGHKCPVKLGKLPREVRKSDDLDAGLREFRGEHSGRPLVLVDAQAQFANLVADVESELRMLLSVLSTDEIPNDADWDGATVEAE